MEAIRLKIVYPGAATKITPDFESHIFRENLDIVVTRELFLLIKTAFEDQR